MQTLPTGDKSPKFRQCFLVDFAGEYRFLLYVVVKVNFAVGQFVFAFVVDGQDFVDVVRPFGFEARIVVVSPRVV